jgi:NADPH-dependent 2,4-dienoyl-CoA reductase/sulfur reductase-like enzyme
MSRYYESVFRENDVAVRAGAEVARVVGDGAVEAVELAGGDRVPADLVVAGIGVVPATALFEDAGLELDDGVLVDERLATTVEGVWAAGDVARYQDVLFGVRRRVEHWDDAVEQGKLAGRNLMAAPGEAERFEHVPDFFSDVFELSWELWGDPSGADDVVVRGGIEEGSFSTWWLRERRPVAVFVMARPDDEREAAEPLIRARRKVATEALRDEDRPQRPIQDD